MCSLVWKNWASSPLRLLLTLVGIALGVAIVSSVHVLDHNTILSQLVLRRGDFGRVDLELRRLGERVRLEERREQLGALPEIAHVGLFGRADLEVLVGGRTDDLVPLYGLAPVGAASFDHYRVLRGRDLSDLDPEEKVLVSPAFASARGLEIGSRFEVQALGLDRSTTCVGGRRVPRATGDQEKPAARMQLEVQGILEPFRLARRDGGKVVLGRFALARKLARVFVPRIQVRRAAGVDPDVLIEKLRDDYEIEDSRTALLGEGADERAFRNGVKVLGCLALMLGMFVIFHTLSHSLAERIRTVGILRCLAATQTQVSLVFLTDALILSLAGAVIGLLGGVLLARLLPALGFTTLGFGKPVVTFELPWSSLLQIGGLSVFFTMLGAAFPLMKVHRLHPRHILHVKDLAPPADLLRGVHLFLFVLLVVAMPLSYLAMTPLLQSEGRGAGLVMLQVGGLVALFFAVLLLSPRLVRWLGRVPLAAVRRILPLACFLVGKNLLRSPGRLASSVCGLGLVALALVGQRALTGSLKGEIRDFARKGMHRRLFLKCDPLPEGAWAKLRAVPGVASVLPLAARATIAPFLTVGTDAAALAEPGGALSASPQLVLEMEKKRGMLISSRLARLRSLAPGDRIRAATDQGPVSYEVLAVNDREGFFPDERAYALCDRRWFKEDFCLDISSSDRFALRLEEGAGADEVSAAVRSFFVKNLPVKLSWIRSGEEKEAEHLADVDIDFRYMDILLVLLLVLAGTGQVNLTTLTALARSREIGVLRALGLTRGDFVGVLLVEASVVGFITGLLTIVAGLPLSWILIRGLRQVSGLNVPYHAPLAAALLVALACFLLSLLSALLPALSAAGKAPATAVRASE
ncbi:MAG: FtsX-like permease family protein [Planctomycetota bacterium]